MAYINVDNRIMNNLKSDNITAVLNSIIDNELEKDESQIDTKLVNECVDALIALEEENGNNIFGLVPLMSADQFLNTVKPREKGWKSLNAFVRVAVIAAALAGSTFTVNAAVESATGVNIIETIGDAVHDKLENIGLIKSGGIDQFDADDDDEEDNDNNNEPTTAATVPVTEIKTEPTTVETTTAVPSTTKHGIDQFDDSDDDEAPTAKPTTEQSTTQTPVQTTVAEPATKPSDKTIVVLKSLNAEFYNFKTDYIYGEELSYDGLKLTAVYSDGSTKPVELSDCNYTKSVDMNTTGNHTLRIIYETCTVKIDITVRPDEDTRGSEICSNALYDYLLTEKGAYITAYHSNETNINLDLVDGYPVIAIGSGVFAESDAEYVVAHNVEKIFPEAFKDCDKLVDCYTPSAVYIGDSAFRNCVSLEQPVYSPDLTYFGTAVFSNTAITDITIPDTITEIPAELCNDCSSLKTVIFDGKVTKIGNSAFSECTALESVSGTENIIEAGSYAFYNDSVVDFEQPPSKLEIAGDYAFAFCNNLSFGSLSSNIKQIGQYSFSYCYKLNDVTIPSAVTEIPEGAFRGAHISDLIIPDGVKVIENYAFMSTEFTSLNLPDSIERIGTYSLYSVRLKNIYFGKNINSIGSNAVYRSSRLIFYVYDNTAALDYAVTNKINYVILEDDSSYPGIDIFIGEDD